MCVEGEAGALGCSSSRMPLKYPAGAERMQSSPGLKTSCHLCSKEVRTLTKHVFSITQRRFMEEPGLRESAPTRGLGEPGSRSQSTSTGDSAANKQGARFHAKGMVAEPFTPCVSAALSMGGGAWNKVRAGGCSLPLRPSCPHRSVQSRSQVRGFAPPAVTGGIQFPGYLERAGYSW